MFIEFEFVLERGGGGPGEVGWRFFIEHVQDGGIEFVPGGGGGGGGVCLLSMSWMREADYVVCPEDVCVWKYLLSMS